LQTLLDGIGSRLAETRETSRYLIGVLIFLGLLGTFYGLLETVRWSAGFSADSASAAVTPPALSPISNRDWNPRSPG